jgi:hypothetical protein
VHDGAPLGSYAYLLCPVSKAESRKKVQRIISSSLHAKPQRGEGNLFACARIVANNWGGVMTSYYAMILGMEKNSSKEEGLKVHPVADILPMLEGQELTELAEDIKKNGQRLPIIIHEGWLLDGRNRLQACKLVGVKPWIEGWQPHGKADSRVAFISAVNFLRRHLDAGQRAAYAAEIATLTPGRRERSNTSIEVIKQPEAAKVLKVSLASVQRASRVKKKAKPEIFKTLKDGKMKTSAAERAAKSSETVQRKVVAQIDAGKGVTEPDVKAFAEAEISPEGRSEIGQEVLQQGAAIQRALVKIGKIVKSNQHLTEAGRSGTVRMLRDRSKEIEELAKEIEQRA